MLGELVDFYGADTDWATGLAGRHAAGTDAATVVDAAFSRYAREASDFAGGRARETHASPRRHRSGASRPSPVAVSAPVRLRRSG